MRFTTAPLLALAAVVSKVVAVSSVVGFSSAPSEPIVGETYTVTYFAPDLAVPVSIELLNGEATDLQTVAVLSSSITGGSYEWTVDSSLSNGNDYALRITQGDEVNYFGPFEISGSVTVQYASSQTYELSTASALEVSTTEESAMMSMTHIYPPSHPPSGAPTPSGSPVHPSGRPIHSVHPSGLSIHPVHPSGNYTSPGSNYTIATTTGAGYSMSTVESSQSTYASSDSTVVAFTGGSSGLKMSLTFIFTSLAAVMYFN